MEARRPGRLFVTGYVLAYTGVWMGLLSPLVVVIPLKVNSLVGDQRGPVVLGVVASVGSLLALVANPVWGLVSDRTSSRMGMRRPWMIIGLAIGLIGLALMGRARSTGSLLAGLCVSQLGFNAALAALAAVLADQIPVERRGTVSGLIGMR